MGQLPRWARPEYKCSAGRSDGWLASERLAARLAQNLPLGTRTRRSQPWHSRSVTHGDRRSRFPVDMKQQIVELENRNAELERTNRRLKLEFERAQRLALLDPLTGLGNRRYFDSVVPSELQRAARTRKPLTLFICDVDYFKHFNDSHGHDVGDALLIEVANVLRKFCRRGGDLAIRYAGDEFALLLPDVPRNMAVRFAYNLRIAVQAISSSIAIGASPSAPPLVSAAAVFRDAEPCTAANLAAVADRALYRAKGAGRNRSVLALCRGSAGKLNRPPAIVSRRSRERCKDAAGASNYPPGAAGPNLIGPAMINEPLADNSWMSERSYIEAVSRQLRAARPGANGHAVDDAQDGARRPTASHRAALSLGKQIGRGRLGDIYEGLDQTSGDLGVDRRVAIQLIDEPHRSCTERRGRARARFGLACGRASQRGQDSRFREGSAYVFRRNGLARGRIAALGAR